MSDELATGLQELTAALRRQSTTIARELHAAGRRARATREAVEAAKQAVVERQTDHSKAVASYRTLRKQAATWMPAAELDRVAPPIRSPR